MQKASVLFSGGKDSSLAAVLLEPFYDIELVTCNFGIVESFQGAQESAVQLGFKHRVLACGVQILEHALDMAMNDGFVNNAINYIHKEVLTTLSKESSIVIIADGIRRDDRVPMLTPAEVQSIEAKYGVAYIRPLFGYGRSAVNGLVDQYLVCEENESTQSSSSDYEVELRALMRARFTDNAVAAIFPDKHIQSHIFTRKRHE